MFYPTLKKGFGPQFDCFFVCNFIFFSRTDFYNLKAGASHIVLYKHTILMAACRYTAYVISFVLLYNFSSNIRYVGL